MGGEDESLLSLMLLWWKAAQLMSLLKLASVSWINSVIARRGLSLGSQHSLVTGGAMLPLWLREGCKSFTLQTSTSKKDQNLNIESNYFENLNVERWLKWSPLLIQIFWTFYWMKHHFVKLLVERSASNKTACRIWISSTWCRSRLSVKETSSLVNPRDWIEMIEDSM